MHLIEVQIRVTKTKGHRRIDNAHQIIPETRTCQSIIPCFCYLVFRPILTQLHIFM